MPLAGTRGPGCFFAEHAVKRKPTGQRQPALDVWEDLPGFGAWAAAVRLIGLPAETHPGRAVVLYAWGADLETTLGAGFEPLGPQNVWIR